MKRAERHSPFRGRMGRLLCRLRAEEAGQGLTEYGVLVTLIAIGTLSLLSLLYETVAGVFGRAADALRVLVSP
jgi:Flp pilus assembly pilin Flp